ncbi:MAG: aldehyde ferredoxin oxidoreductase C-terminal domain-containing protein [Actinomycetota bacterium]|nr:aldehyde ferredoxin oxidoreductase C-terminal domain-containing protein [Actinomycetota bacterium]
MIPFSHRDKGRLIWLNENRKILADSLGICLFAATMLINTGHMDAPLLSGAYRRATDLETDEDHPMRSAERAYLLMRCFNAKRLATSKDDSYNRRSKGLSLRKNVDLSHSGILDGVYFWESLVALMAFR